jgi:hypothetical protein
MTDPNNKIIRNINEQINRRDLETILEVNRKAIEIETNVADQNENIIENLNKIKEVQQIQEERTEKIMKQSEELGKEIFKLQILFITGLFSVIIQIIQFFLKK